VTWRQCPLAGRPDRGRTEAGLNRRAGADCVLSTQRDGFTVTHLSAGRAHDGRDGAFSVAMNGEPCCRARISPSASRPRPLRYVVCDSVGSFD